jgi:RNA polymerase sigma factor (TIGR02999 family)
LPPELYGELRGVAGRLMAQERPGHTLSPTALLHEAWLKLDQGQPRLADRRHVFALAARVMRHLLVDHALARQASKRGDGLEPVTLSAAELLGDEGRGDPAELLAVHQALERLSQEDARCAQVMELRGFGGLSLEEIGAELGISLATVKREWVYGRAWMARALGAGA